MSANAMTTPNRVTPQGNTNQSVNYRFFCKKWTTVGEELILGGLFFTTKFLARYFNTK